MLTLISSKCLEQSIFLKKNLAYKNSHIRRDVLKKKLLKAEGNNTQKTVMKQMCETRWIERHTVLSDFARYIEVIVSSLEDINTLGSQHALAFPFLQAIQSFEFISSLIICSEISELMLPVTRYLQTRGIDLFQAKLSVNTLLNLLKNRRENVDEYFGSVYEKIILLAKNLNVDPKSPRLCSKQIQRANAGSEGVQDIRTYYKLNIYIPFLDHCILELSERFGAQFSRICELQTFLPNTIIKSTPATIKKAVQSIDYPDISKSSLLIELELWQQMWKDNRDTEKPNTALTSIPYCYPTLYPNVRKIIEVLCVIPVTSSEPERSFSTLRRIKTWLRSTTSENRLNGLALLNIHREVEVKPEDVIDIFSAKKNRRLDLVFTQH